MPDITRFDFHVMRFMESEWVQQMSASQVGQYILLMCKAWLQGKDTTLPDNPGLLAAWAKVDAVDQIVLDRFPVVQTNHGMRRRNEALYREWQDTIARSFLAPAANGSLGGSSTSEAKAEAARRNGLLGGRPKTQAEPNTPSSTQPDSTQIESVTSTSGQSRFANLSARYRKAFGVAISTHKRAKNDYAVACHTYGEDTVLAMFDQWSTEPGNDWIREKRHPYGIKSFYEQLNEQIASSKQQQEENPQEAVDRKTVQAMIEAQKNETESILADKREAEASALAKVDQWF